MVLVSDNVLDIRERRRTEDVVGMKVRQDEMTDGERGDTPDCLSQGIGSGKTAPRIDDDDRGLADDEAGIGDFSNRLAAQGGMPAEANVNTRSDFTNIGCNIGFNTVGTKLRACAERNQQQCG